MSAGQRGRDATCRLSTARVKQLSYLSQGVDPSVSDVSENTGVSSRGEEEAARVQALSWVAAREERIGGLRYVVEGLRYVVVRRLNAQFL
jgi:hypothetical protein